MLTFPATIRPDGNSFTLEFPDLPFGGHTCGKDEEEALRHAPGALKTALSLLIEKGMPIPSPKRARRGHSISLPSIVDDAKVELYQSLKKAGIRKAELARRMGIHKQQVERLLNLDHTSRIEQLELAFRALGKQLVTDIRDAS